MNDPGNHKQDRFGDVLASLTKTHRLVSAVIIMLVAAVDPVMAACDLRISEHVHALRVLDGETIELSDHRQVRLINAAPVKTPLVPDGNNGSTLAAAAKAALTKLVLGKKIVLRFGGRRKDRYGRLLAHVFLSNGKWVQGAMVSRGLARAYSFFDNHACIKDLLTRETLARRARTGLWRVEKYQIKLASNIEQLIAVPNRFVLVEGRVLKVAKFARRIFLNFNKDWKTDFTITIAPASVKFFTKARIDLRAMANQRIRVRGWIELRNGPSIEVTHPSQIEFLDVKTSHKRLP